MTFQAISISVQMNGNFLATAVAVGFFFLFVVFFFREWKWKWKLPNEKTINNFIWTLGRLKLHFAAYDLCGCVCVHVDKFAHVPIWPCVHKSVRFWVFYVL